MSPRRETVWVTDLAGEQVDAIGHGFFDLWTDVRLDQSESMGFEVAADHPKASRLIPDADLVHRSRRFYVVEVEQLRRGPTTTIGVEALALWYRLGDQLYVGSFVATTLTPRQGLEAILDGSGWTIGGQTSLSTTTFSMEEQDKSRLGLLRSWAKITGRSIVFDTFTQNVDLVDTRGVSRGLAFRYGRNVKGMRRRVRAPETTRLYAYGADDLSIAGLNGTPYVEDFTYYTDRGLTLEQAQERFARSKMFSDSSFVVDTDLLAAAEDRLDEMAVEQVAYEIDVVDLAEFSEIAEVANVGDTVGVHDPDFAEDVRPIVTRYRRHWLQPWRNKIELSTIPPVISDGSSSARPSSSEEWLQFLGRVTADFLIRDDAVYTVARIPLRFREGGRANYHVEMYATGVGTGTMHVEVYDAETDAVVWFAQEVAFTDGDPVRVVTSWAAEELSGRKDYRLRVTTDGGGVDLVEQDPAGPVGFWILAQGAVRETPTEPNSVTYNHTGAVQSFTVPDNVTEIEVVARGGAGGDFNGPGGNGGEVSARFAVVPGTEFDVYVGGQAITGTTPGWPNGGTGGSTIASSVGRGGGGASYLVAPGGAITAALIVAGAGGGAGLSDGYGGAAGFHAGDDGLDGQSGGGGGATQAAGGVGGTSGGGGVGEAGDTDGQGQGGDGAAGGGSLGYGGGGGGGGWHGGGGAGSTGSFGGDHGGGGGGGSGYVDPSGFDLAYSDGSNNGHGQVVISWETPVI